MKKLKQILFFSISLIISTATFATDDIPTLTNTLHYKKLEGNYFQGLNVLLSGNSIDSSAIAGELLNKNTRYKLIIRSNNIKSIQFQLNNTDGFIIHSNEFPDIEFSFIGEATDMLEYAISNINSLFLAYTVKVEPIQ